MQVHVLPSSTVLQTPPETEPANQVLPVASFGSITKDLVRPPTFPGPLSFQSSCSVAVFNCANLTFAFLNSSSR